MPHKVTVLECDGFIVMLPNEPEKGKSWWPTNDNGNIGCVLGDTKKQLACSREALDLMGMVKRNRDSIGDLGWWACDDGTHAFSWIGAIYRLIDPRNAEGDRDFRVHSDSCTIVPNEIPPELRDAVKDAIALKRHMWREPYRLETGLT